MGRISSGERTFQLLAEAGNYGVGIVAVTIEEAIHASLHPLSQRLERNGDDAGSEERRDHPTFGFEQRTHTHDDENVESGNERGQHRVDQRPVDDKIDVEQTLTQDGDPGRQRQSAEGQSPQHAVPLDAVTQTAERQHQMARESDGHDRRGESDPLQLLPLHSVRTPQPKHHRGRRRDGTAEGEREADQGKDRRQRLGEELR